MPLARVRTNLSSIPQELKQQLKLAGYDIEIVPPGKKRSKPADLELTIDSLPVREALNAAAQAATVYLAPGALSPAAQVVTPPQQQLRPVPPVPVYSDAETEQQLLARRRAEQQAVEAERLRREQQQIREEQERQRVEQQRLQQQQAEQQRLEQQRIQQQHDEQQRVAQERAEQQRLERQQADEQKAVALRAEQQRVESAHQSRIQAERERVEAEALQRERVLQMWREAEARHTAPSAQNQEEQRLEQERRNLEIRAQQEREAEARRQAELAEAERFQHLREQQQREVQAREEEHRLWQAEQARIRDEQEQLRLELQRKEEAVRAEQEKARLELQRKEDAIRAEQEQLRLEFERKQEEIRAEQQRFRAERERFVRDRLMADQAAERARQQAAVVVPPAPSNVVPISASTLEPAIMEPTVIRTASGETANITVTPVAKGAQFVERRRRPRLPLIEGGARRLRHKEYRRAAIAAAGLTALVMVLWIALSARQPASPLPTSQLVRGTGIEQASPFGPAKLNAPVQSNSPAAKAPQPVAPRQAAPARQSAATTPATKSTKPVAAKPTPKKNLRVRRAPVSDNQDVIVRHFGLRTPTTANKKTASTKDGVKVFSDMD